MHCGHASRPVILCFASFFRQIAKILQTWAGRGLESTGIDSLGASAVSLNGLESTGIGSLGASAVSLNGLESTGIGSLGASAVSLNGLESTGIGSLGASAVSLNGLESTGIGSLGASAVSSNEFSMSFNLDITKEAFVSILRTKNLIICLCFAEAVCTHVQNSFRCICMKTGKLHIRL